MNFSYKVTRNAKRLQASFAALVLATLVVSASGQQVSEIPVTSGGPTNDYNNGVGSTVFSFNVQSSVTVTDVRFRLAMSHSYVLDIDATLESPSGTMVHLFELVGDDGPPFNTHFADVEFRDDAISSIGQTESGSDPGTDLGPWSGSYRCQADQSFDGVALPVQVLNAFAGENPMGTWTLTIRDYGDGDTGYVYAAGDDTNTIPSVQTRFGSAQGTALIFITNGPLYTNIEQWRLDHFGSPLNAGMSANDFDYDSDGMMNLLEYALGLNPTLNSGSNGSAGAPFGGFEASNDRLVLSVKIPNPAPDKARYEVKASGDLKIWDIVATKIGIGAWSLETGATLSATPVAGGDLVAIGDFMTGTTNVRRMMKLDVVEN